MGGTVRSLTNTNVRDVAVGQSIEQTLLLNKALSNRIPTVWKGCSSANRNSSSNRRSRIGGWSDKTEGLKSETKDVTVVIMAVIMTVVTAVILTEITTAATNGF